MRWQLVFACLFVLAQCAIAEEFDLGAHAKDLEITIRPHAEMLVFGDPLFLEVSVVNRAKETVRAPAPGLLEFIAKERDSDLQLSCPGGGWPPGLSAPVPVVSYTPNQPVTRIIGIGLPPNIKYVPKNIDDLGHPFWRRLVGGGSLGIRCMFYFDQSGLQIASNEALISIRPRPQKEIAALQELSEYEKRSGDELFLFGFIGLDGLRDRVETARLAGTIRSGELADSLKLSRLMQQLNYDAEIDRVAINQQVLDWVAAQPDIKRQFIAQHLSSPRYQFILTPDAQKRLIELGKGAAP